MTRMNLPMPTDERFHADRSVPIYTPQGQLVRLPKPGWWRKATCKDIDCPKYIHGWITLVPATSVDLLEQVRRYQGWRFTERKVSDDMIEFRFPPGQTCVNHLTGTGHLVPIERDPIFRHNINATSQVWDYDQFFYTFNEQSYKAQRHRQQQGVRA